MGEPRILGQIGELWAIEKPSGWVVHATHSEETHDLRAWIRKNGLPKGAAPLHRLDRGTSGVVLFSADRTLRAELGACFAAGEIKKRYRALAIGKTRKKGIIRRNLVERGTSYPAITRWRSTERLGGFTLLTVRPETGRKHQIRQHLLGIGHPIVGDDRYRPRRFVPVPAFPRRLWLHAAQITLPDGTVFTSPLPPELNDHLQVLRSSSHASTPEPPETPDAERR